MDQRVTSLSEVGACLTFCVFATLRLIFFMASVPIFSTLMADMLKRISVRGYRALKEFALDLPNGKPLVIIGENASGKSTILDAVGLVCSIAMGQVGRAILERGGWEAVSWRGISDTIEFTIRFSKESEIFQKDGEVEYFVRLGAVRSIPTVLDEEVRVFKGQEKPFIALKGGVSSWVSNKITKVKDQVPPSQSDGSIGTNTTISGIYDESKYPTPIHVKQALQSIACYPPFSLSTTFERRESYETLGNRPVERVMRIAKSGKDLQNALYTLSSEHPFAWRELLSDIRSVFPWCHEIKFPPGAGRGTLNMTWTDARSETLLYLDDMSEGMRVYLALLASFHAQDTPSLLAYDEPERSLHPNAMRRLVKVIETRASSTPILLATHADQLLDYLEDPVHSIVISRFSKNNGVYLETLDEDLLMSWRSEYSLSELRAKRMLEGEPFETDLIEENQQ